MLRLIEDAEFDRCVDFAYELALDPARSGYPTYCDGMKTREDFICRTKLSLERPYEDVLLFLVDEVVEGFIAFEHLEKDRYIHTYVFNIRRDTGAALAEFVDYCRERWSGFTLDLGFPAENVDALSWLERTGVPCIERSWNFLLDLEQYQLLPPPSDVERITVDNFEAFAAIHRQIQGEMYWNCDRVRDTMDRWDIFITEEGSAAGEVLMTSDEDPHQEIFALDFTDRQYHAEPFRALLTAALNSLKEKGGRWLTSFANEGDPGGEVLKELGFRLIGTYVGHRLTL